MKERRLAAREAEDCYLKEAAAMLGAAEWQKHKIQAWQSAGSARADRLALPFNGKLMIGTVAAFRHSGQGLYRMIQKRVKGVLLENVEQRDCEEQCESGNPGRKVLDGIPGFCRDYDRTLADRMDYRLR